MVVGGRNVHKAAIPPPTATSGAIAPIPAVLCSQAGFREQTSVMKLHVVEASKNTTLQFESNFIDAPYFVAVKRLRLSQNS